MHHPCGLEEKDRCGGGIVYTCVTASLLGSAYMLAIMCGLKIQQTYLYYTRLGDKTFWPNTEVEKVLQSLLLRYRNVLYMRTKGLHVQKFEGAGSCRATTQVSWGTACYVNIRQRYQQSVADFRRIVQDAYELQPASVQQEGDVFESVWTMKVNNKVCENDVPFTATKAVAATRKIKVWVFVMWTSSSLLSITCSVPVIIFARMGERWRYIVVFLVVGIVISTILMTIVVRECIASTRATSMCRAAIELCGRMQMTIINNASRKSYDQQLDNAQISARRIVWYTAKYEDKETHDWLRPNEKLLYELGFSMATKSGTHGDNASSALVTMSALNSTSTVLLSVLSIWNLDRQGIATSVLAVVVTLIVGAFGYVIAVWSAIQQMKECSHSSTAMLLAINDNSANSIDQKNRDEYDECIDHLSKTKTWRVREKPIDAYSQLALSDTSEVYIIETSWKETITVYFRNTILYQASLSLSKMCGTEVSVCNNNTFLTAHKSKCHRGLPGTTLLPCPVFGIIFIVQLHII